ncbi:hypothetical protein P9272_35060 [Mesorhizobium sp. WSM4976]|uniref:hypothetical protein n=1 Tax=Mesorhizobium sp. WSM4976 TaxID=3038549 RepID=UPI0024161974|nr:hypothetical protein [Mesorhizobium sp. WSM4976]MDG4898730.1 hypothetical protein [Mesorhizobium sp. WSM4976]
MSRTLLTDATEQTATSGKSSRWLNRDRVSVLLIALGCVALLLGGFLLYPGFLKPGYILQQLQIAAFLGIIATGAMMVILLGEIDLSVPWTITRNGDCRHLGLRQLQSPGRQPGNSAGPVPRHGGRAFERHRCRHLSRSCDGLDAGRQRHAARRRGFLHRQQPSQR